MSENFAKSYTAINIAAIESWIEQGWEWGKPLTHEDYLAAEKGELKVLLTPLKYVPREWFGELKGKRLLGLASGGGQQMPVFAAAGAICTVFDYSDKQLESEKLVSEREHYTIDIVKGDMTKEFPFASESFDVVFNPVSLCYVKDISHVFGECYRVMAKGAVLLTGLDNGICYAFDDEQEKLVNCLPYDPLSSKELFESSLKANDGIQFSHTPGEIISAVARAGFIIEDSYDDIDNQGMLGKHNVPTFIAIKARK